MSSIIQATTPLIKYVFKTINVTDITEAYLTIDQNRAKILEKDIDEATVDTENNLICWGLTQEETLHFANTYITVMLNWKTTNGIRGASKKDTIFIENNLKKEVI